MENGLGPDGLDETIVDSARNGDEAALSVVWRTLNPAVVRYLRALGQDDAQDVASIVWIDVARALPSLRQPDLESLRRLIFTIARRRMVDEFRNRTRSREASHESPPDTPGGESAELDGALAILRRLPPVQAEIIALRVIAGLSAAEVGEITGRTAAAVRVIAHRGLLALRNELSPAEEPMIPTDQYRTVV